MPGVPASALHTLPAVEFAALWRLRRGGDGERILHHRNTRFQTAIPHRALRSHRAVIGFDTSGWILARRCQEIGVPFLLDRTIAHPAAYARIMTELARRYPDWTGPVVPRPAEIVAAEAEEHTRAARIIVGGSFALNTLVAEGVDPGKIIVNPYGVDWEAFAPPAMPTSLPARPLRFLFVGSVIARKGVPILLDAWRSLAPKEAELWIAGRADPHIHALIPSLPGLKLLGQVPHADLPSIYAQTDVLVLPSLFEGFGLVLLEALAAGLPVIATPHTGAVDYINTPTLGQIVPAGSCEALIAALRHTLDSPPQRAAVLTTAGPLAATFSWKAYGDRWSQLLAEMT